VCRASQSGAHSEPKVSSLLAADAEVYCPAASASEGEVLSSLHFKHQRKNMKFLPHRALQELLEHPFLHPVATPASAPSSGRGLSQDEARQLIQVSREVCM
jgi:hypothetical protein